MRESGTEGEVAAPAEQPRWYNGITGVYPQFGDAMNRRHLAICIKGSSGYKVDVKITGFGFVMLAVLLMTLLDQAHLMPLLQSIRLH